MATKFNEIGKTGNSDADRLHDILKHEGIDFASGVPCGVLKYFIKNFEGDDEILQVPAQNEPESIGIAAGAYLGGKYPALYMQNSGLLKSVNDIGSLLIPYSIPSLFLVTYRGCDGEDAPQHKITGGITKPVLEALDLYHSEITPQNLEQSLADAFRYMKDKRKPAVLLFKRGWSDNTYADEIRGSGAQEKNICMSFEDDIAKEVRYFQNTNEPGMKREDALDAIMEASGKEDAIFSTTGLMSRSLFQRHDSPNQFYNTGSFGLVSSVGLGFSMTKKDKRVVVVDGDSSLLTNFGTLVSVGAYHPENYTHIVVDNNSYGSCSEERSCSENAKLPEAALLQDYASSYEVDTKQDLIDIIKETEDKRGPHFIHAKIDLGGERRFKRPMDLTYVADRFRDYFND